MFFSSPFALFGLITAATPVVIYFLLRRRKTEVDWGASYLLRLTLRSKRKASIWKQIVVLALRVLVLAAGALLLAGVLWPNPEPSRTRPALPPRPVHRVILMDNTLSMTAESEGTARLTRLQAAVDALLADLRVGDWASLVPLNAAQPMTRAGPLPGRERRALLESITVRPGAVDFSAGLAACLARLARTPRAVAELYVLSDFPREMLAQVQHLDWFSDSLGERTLRLVPVSLAGAMELESYVVLERIGLGSDLVLQGVPVNLYVEASCYGTTGMDVPFVCRVDGAQVQQLEIPFKANEAQRFALPLRFDAPGEVVVQVRTEESRLPAHAQQTLAVQVEPRLTVWIVAEDVGLTDAAALQEDEFIQRAFAASSQPRPAVEMVRTDAHLLTRPIPAEVDVILICAPRFALAATRGPLLRFVQRGGGLILAGTAGMELQGYREHYGDLLPGRLEEQARSQTDPQVFSFIRGEALAEEALLFREFASAAGGDLADVRVYNHLALEAETPGEVVFRLTNGDPVLLRRGIGRGWVYLWTSSLTISWTALPVRQSFVPFLTRLLHAAAAGSVWPRNLDPGKTVVLPWPHGEAPQLTGPGGTRQQLAPVNWGEKAYIVLSAPPAPGLYRVGGEEDSGAAAHFTVCGTVPEGDLRSLTAAEGEAMAAVLGAPIHQGWGDAVAACGPADAFQAAWPWLLVAMLAMYLAETWLVRTL